MFELNSGLQIAVHSGSELGSILNLLEGFLSSLETLAGLSPVEWVRFLLPGVFALQNIHPLFVHFPIALLSSFFVIDLIGLLAGLSSWRVVASGLLYLGTVLAGMTVAAGFQAAETVVHNEAVHEIMENHEHLGVSVLILAGLLSAWRLIFGVGSNGVANYFHVLVAGLLSLLLIFTADLGGLMVYHYGVSVGAAAESLPNEIGDEHHHTH